MSVSKGERERGKDCVIKYILCFEGGKTVKKV